MNEQQRYDTTTPLEIGDWCYLIDPMWKGAIVQIWQLPDKNNPRYGVKRDGFTGLTLKREDMAFVDRPKNQ